MDDSKIDLKNAARISGHSIFIGAHSDSEVVLNEIDKLKHLQSSETRFGNIFC